MNIYEVLDFKNAYSYNDFEEKDKLRMNNFFKENYRFEFKNINGKVFEVQLKNAIMRTSKTIDIIIEMARAVLNHKESFKNYVTFY